MLQNSAAESYYFNIPFELNELDSSFKIFKSRKSRKNMLITL